LRKPTRSFVPNYQVGPGVIVGSMYELCMS
jgi:hypothetical protein